MNFEMSFKCNTSSDKMGKYEMGPTSNIEDTEWTQFCP